MHIRQLIGESYLILNSGFMSKEITKVIHYCWFGRNPLPESAQKCIASWRKYLPDYEIIEWNEDNYDVNSIPYTAQAYEAKKYAFVSDYARFKILYEYGGLYFDTDVEVIRPLGDIIASGPFMGFEIDPDGKGYRGDVAPGLGLGAFPKMELYSDIMKAYKTFKFLNEDGSTNTKTVVKYITEILETKGLSSVKGIQEIDGLTIYPKEYFNPLNDNTGVLKVTENTRSIHWYAKSWLKPKNKLYSKIIKMCHRLFGDNSLSWVKHFVGK